MSLYRNNTPNDSPACLIKHRWNLA